MDRGIRMYFWYCFAFLGHLTTIFNLSHQQYMEALSHYPFSSIILAISKTVPVWQAILLSFAGITFPVSRITRMQLVAHSVDMLFLIACTFIPLRFFKDPELLKI